MLQDQNYSLAGEQEKTIRDKCNIKCGTGTQKHYETVPGATWSITIFI
jgi:hypothetical protein